jgi:hypothetical protein
MTNPHPTTEDPWQPFAGGSSIGQNGSDEGTITRDEAHPLGARITLEREPAFVPFALTCSIYGWMVHTRYFATEEEAQAAFDEMKPHLTVILDLIRSTDDPEAEAQFSEVRQALEDFVTRFPRLDQTGT